MTRLRMLIAVIGCAFLSWPCDAAETEQTRQAVLIRVVVGEGDSAATPGKRRILAEPTLATILGRPATLQTGGEILSNPGDKQSPALQCGTFLRVHVDEATPGKVKGELRLEITNKTETESEEIVSTTGVVIQQAGTFTLGKTYRLGSKDKSTTWVEVTITDAKLLAQPAIEVAPRR